MSNKMTTFEMVSQMNLAFGNPKGDPLNIDWAKVRNQCKNIADELAELFAALGANADEAKEAAEKMKAVLSNPPFEPQLDHVRDALCDISVFGTGAHHFMGIDADRDMQSVINGVMSRFIKDDRDKEATYNRHQAKGVFDVYYEGTYPTMVMKSAIDQPDAPKGKFLKSASYKEPVFYDVRENLTSKIFSEDAQKKLAEAGSDIHLINGTSGDQPQ